MLLGLLLLAGQAQETGTFDDDDPDNDPNVCFTVPDPENCDWVCGWYQAALNLGHVSLEVARSVCPDMQRTSWRPGPPETAEERDDRLQSDLARYLDDDPTNDPNPCFESDDPDCDWEAGWYASLANIGASILADDTISPADKQSFQSFWDAYQKYQEQFEDDDDGKPNFGAIRWFCAPGETSCERPTRECRPGENPTNGGCFFYG